jgi:protein-disulfide isomerase
MAKAIGLDVAQFRRDMDARGTADTIAANQQLCTENEATGTPSFFINGRLLTGAQPFERFETVIDEELAGGGGL